MTHENRRRGGHTPAREDTIKDDLQQLAILAGRGQVWIVLFFWATKVAGVVRLYQVKPLNDAKRCSGEQLERLKIIVNLMDVIVASNPPPTR